MRAIVTFTVAGGKRLIAKGIAHMPEVQRVRKEGKILLLAGTTVSAVAEELVGEPMRLSGRINPRGLRGASVVDGGYGGSPLGAFPANVEGKVDSSQFSATYAHSAIVEGSRARNVDSILLLTISHLTSSDLVICGANVIDAFGGAAVMAGGPMGGTKGPLLTSIMAEGIPVIVAAGLEKLIPGTLAEAVQSCGRRWADRAVGMSVGLMPIFGKIVTEVEAIKALAPVECQVIGKGGIDGAEGGVTLAISGEDAQVEKLFHLALQLRDATTSGSASSRGECVGPTVRCHRHKACPYKSPKLIPYFLEGKRTVPSS